MYEELKKGMELKELTLFIDERRVKFEKVKIINNNGISLIFESQTIRYKYEKKGVRQKVLITIETIFKIEKITGYSIINREEILEEKPSKQEDFIDEEDDY